MPFEFSETQLRLTAFIGVFVLMAVVEALLPKRERREERKVRWFTNLGLVVIDSVTVLVIFPIAAVGVAFWAQQQGYGLFNMTGVPGWLAGLLSFVILDFAIYLQHVATHKIPILWRVHRVHHADHDLDVSSGLRFHPIEITLSVAYKIAWVTLIGAPPLSVFLFEVVLNACAMWNHANFNLPKPIDRILRKVIVTPDMHRVHHSILRNETDANYGFNLSIWDRLFRTYIAQPEKGHHGMTIGLPDRQDDGPQFLLWSLLFPFKGERPEREWKPQIEADTDERPSDRLPEPGQ
ncbi:MAG: sterol desaturase family protein [Rhodobiaceae bacterium]|nr:sterol desaturase family protein [Rhodobiaceae bacterium]